MRRLALAWCLLLVGGCALPEPLTLDTVDFVQLSAGGDQSCGLAADHHVFCWGTAGGPLPTLVSVGPLLFQEVSAGGSLVCALTDGGAVDCWRPGLEQPFLLSGPAEVAHVVAGEFPCASTSGGTIYCWNEDFHGAPQRISGDGEVADLSVGSFACGLTADGHIRCWGGPMSATPVALFDSLTFTQVVAMHGWGCGVPTGGTAACFTVGDDGNVGALKPVPTGGIVDGTRFVTVAGSAGRVTLLSDGGRAYFLDRADSTIGKEFSGVKWAWVTGGAAHACGYLITGLGVCFGNNGAGQLGDGTYNSSATVVKIGGWGL